MPSMLIVPAWDVSAGERVRAAGLEQPLAWAARKSAACAGIGFDWITGDECAEEELPPVADAPSCSASGPVAPVAPSNRAAEVTAGEACCDLFVWGTSAPSLECGMR